MEKVPLNVFEWRRITDPISQMEFVEAVAALALLDLPFFKFASQFCELTEKMTLADSVIIETFWLGATYHRPMDLPDTAGLCWREAILRCLGSVRARAGTQSSAAIHGFQPPSAATSNPLTRKAANPPRSAATPPRESAANPPTESAAIPPTESAAIPPTESAAIPLTESAAIPPRNVTNPLVPSSSPVPVLVPSSSPVPPLVPSSSPVPPLV
ncbi:mucin-7-like [Onychostoma macrolepis]|uniref:Uncharacterized protein n=1 Tax=Onychostoma macrolepis TaxID=369639 RepID=A0A7J6CGP3_9TELE|nr:mucin-7-like [Onychostoma macrolepis]XP_058649384.1 mucin-7-like [Onychostoma macrolepis]XP_058649385.1 mucin-7-like [Onychostoma macrolepis]XP_058649386.1 mucin-7-like [Onychostoma macrolepis]XP_058649387.1 mucin-7-like [Onychostoma macrolepis]XP_058649388.1 mucin-7-like [Onychostoma macrolepis]XP_058649389.1 mucin-7-like [Onychostoma macrolepis]KAF4106296.1 hypothetical protein G5714_012286 [Onychostoma macrolepis]